LKAKEKKFTITLKWHIGRKIEQIKFDYETEIRGKVTWDEFFKKVEMKMSNNKNRRR